MKKLVSLKGLMVGILSLIIIFITTSVFATDSVLESGDNSATTEVSSTDLNQAQTIPTDGNYSTSDNSAVVSSGNNTSNGVSTSSAYNTVDNEEEDEDNLPQTGIEDYNIGILLVICVAASIYTYKKMKDYKNV